MRRPVHAIAPAKFFNLKTATYEFAGITSNVYWDRMIHHVYMIFAAQTIAARRPFTATGLDPITILVRLIPLAINLSVGSIVFALGLHASWRHVIGVKAYLVELWFPALEQSYGG